MENEKHLKNIIASYQNQPIDFDVYEVDAFLSKRLNKPKRKVTKNALMVFSFLLLGAGLYLIKFRKPITHKPVISEAIILKEKFEIKPKPVQTLVKKLVSKKQKITKKKSYSETTILDDNQDLVDINNNLAINEDKVDYSVYNNISDMSNTNEYDNINDLMKN